jgi:beta-mannosidase
MKRINILIIIVLYTCFACNTSQRGEVQRQFLNTDWQFEYQEKWYPATIPGTIHTDLFNNQLIEDPFFGNNEQSLQWIEKKSWTYQCVIFKDFLQEKAKNELIFDGLDTYSEVFLNGKPLCHTFGSNITDNMFRKWVFPLNMDDLQDSNILKIIFYPTSVMDSTEAATYPYPLPDIRAFSRKAPYQSGWDWGPRLVTCGIWKNVYIESWEHFRILDFQIQQEEINRERANIKVTTKCEFASNAEALFQYYINEELFKSENIQLTEGNNTIETDIKIDKPKLWYPNGMGEQPLYNVRVKIITDKEIDTKSTKIGLRKIELIQKKDSIGKSFFFKVNEQSVFVKGANWVPSEFFAPMASKEKYKNLLTACKESHINMLRCWGGAYYEDDAFYDFCDEMGIMIWQDFMFAGALYPEEKSFHENIAIEAREQIQRLRNHPCLALWCGNNEVKNAWEDWGWQSTYSEKQKTAISNNLSFIFNHILADAVAKYDPSCSYTPTSPLWGWGHPENFTEGDSHYWGVWWGELPFEVWDEKTGRFMSEYGFQSYPEMSSIQKFTLPEDRNLDSPAMKNHQKHGRGLEIINKAMCQYFGKATDFENFVYLSQLTQAYGIGLAIEAHRSHKPSCMGTLYWQLNDCWAVASWSSIDYYGRKKAVWYVSREKFAPLMIYSRNTKDETAVNIKLVSDKTTEMQGIITYKLLDFHGNIIDVKSKNFSAFPDVNHEDMYVLNNKMKDFKKTSCLYIQFVSKEGDTVCKIHYFDYPKNLKLPPSNLQWTTTHENGTDIIRLKSAVLIKGVYLYEKNASEGDFSDNYFDILPNQEKIIRFQATDRTRKHTFGLRTYN